MTGTLRSIICIMTVCVIAGCHPQAWDITSYENFTAPAPHLEALQTDDCWKKALSGAMIVSIEKGYPVRIIVGNGFKQSLGSKMTDHAQAQALVDGEWYWISVGRWVAFTESPEHGWEPDFNKAFSISGFSQYVSQTNYGRRIGD